MTNIRSLRNKVDELQLVVEHNSADIVSLTETWLSDDILTDEISIPGQPRTQALCGSGLARPLRGPRGLI